MPLPSLRYWRRWRTVAAYQPITNLIYNTSKWRGQQRWMYRRIGRALSHDPLYIHSLLDHQNHAPTVPPVPLDRMLMVGPVVIYVVGLYLFASILSPHAITLFFVVLLPAVHINQAMGFINGAALSVSEEQDANRFDLLALTPMGTSGVVAALSGVMFRRVQPHPFAGKTWLGRLVMVVIIWVPLLTITFLAWRELDDGMRLAALYNGLLSLPSLALFGAGVLIGYVQALVFAHHMTVIVWNQTSNALLVRIAAIVLALISFSNAYAISLWLALTVLSWAGYPLVHILFTADKFGVPMMMMYVFVALLVALYIAATEVLIWGVARWHRQIINL